MIGNLRALAAGEKIVMPQIQSYGTASGYIPKIKVAFVRRKGDYGMRWPGAIYDGEEARKKYTKNLKKTASKLRINLDLRSSPIYSIEEAESWIEKTK